MEMKAGMKYETEIVGNEGTLRTITIHSFRH